MAYSKLTGKYLKSIPEKQSGVYIIVCKGKHIGRLGMISRVCSHSWYEVFLFPSDRDTLHTKFFDLATEQEIEERLAR